jgi:hypothetical protein
MEERKKGKIFQRMVVLPLPGADLRSKMLVSSTIVVPGMRSFAAHTTSGTAADVSVHLKVPLVS